MTVSQLMTELNCFAPDRMVIISKDPEGNGYSPLLDIHTGAYKAKNTCSGSVGLEHLDDALKEQGYSEEDVIDGIPAIILYPIN